MADFMPEENTSSFEQAASPEKIKIDNPRELLGLYRQSPAYHEAYVGFFAEKKLTDDVTDEEKKEAFEGSDRAKGAFIDFAQQVGGLSYNSDFYSERAQKSLRAYLAMIQDYMKFNRSGDREFNQSNLIALDTMRVAYHYEASGILMEDKVVPNIKLGKALVSLIAISSGLETYELARQDDLTRVRRQLGIIH